MDERIRTILRENARLPIDVDMLSDESDLYGSGMTSHSSVNVMLALENEFDIEFPDRLLRRSVFSSINNIRNALLELIGDQELAYE